MRLYEGGDIRYRQMQLRAARITFDWDASELHAEGAPKDTVVDNAAITDRTLKHLYTGLPVMRDGSEEFEGYTIAYNFGTRRGRMTLTDTNLEGGYYHGRVAKKMENDVLYLADGYYTTCSNPDHPHFYFYSPRMRVVPRSSVAAAPIYLYIMDVPVFGIPFGVFPTQSGRRSGFIAPTFGESARRGRFFTNLGYYFALSDYMDMTSTMDWYARGGWNFDNRLRYSLRYRFTGSFDASTSYTYTGERDDPGRTARRDYRFLLLHNQEIDPTSRISVNFNYMTGQFYQATSLDYDQLLTQNIVSNATYSKRWEGTSNSMSVNVNRDHNIRTDEVRWILPNLSFNRTTSYPFRRDARARGTGAAYQWYELIGYTYSGNVQNYINTVRDFETPDTSLTTDIHAGASHRVNVSASHREGFITYTPRVNYSEVWYTERIERSWDAADSAVVERTERGFFPVRHFDTGISFGTTLYGIFQPRIGRITGFRHTMTPSLAYTFRPDFSSPWWGYYDLYEDRGTGHIVRYNRYGGQPFPSVPVGEQQMISLSVGNVFEMKTAPAAGDTVREERRHQLLNLSASTAYNLAADSLRLSPLSMNFRTSIGTRFSISGNSQFHWYAFDRQLGRVVNRFQVSETGSLLRFINFRVNVSTSLRGGSGRSLPRYDFHDLHSPMNPYGASVRYYDYYHRPAIDMPWDISLSWDFSYDESDPRNIRRRSNIRANASLNLTEKWNIRASGGYDIFTGDFTTPQIVITRDLHCWEMFFSWVPTGFNQHYRLEVRVSAAHLSDLKLSKRGSVRGVY
jgi:hypothetical protein